MNEHDHERPTEPEGLATPASANFSFSVALDHARGGAAVTRRGWKPAYWMCLDLEGEQLLRFFPPPHEPEAPTAVTYSPSQEDMLTDDWCLV